MTAGRGPALQLDRVIRRMVLHLQDFPGRLGAVFLAERGRWMPWLAVWVGLGVGSYFALPEEPPVWVGGALCTLVLPATALSWRRQALIAIPLIAVAAGALGFAGAQARAWMVAAPVLTHPVGPTDVTGRVVEVAPHGARWRITLADVAVPRLRPDETPTRVRVTAWDRAGATPGARVHLRARLLPPPAPAAPGAFDFQRQAWFARIGAVGYAVSLATPVEPVRPSLRDWWEGVRATVGDTLRGEVGGAAGAVAAALVTGQRGAVPDDVIDAYRGSGLAHLLAISGLHMGLAGGIAFVVLRLLFVLLPPWALRWDGKKIAAVGAMVSMAAYLALSGGNVPAQRAFVMGSVVFAAVLVDRSALTFRVLAVAAIVVLLWRPESLVGASFQMSFAAVTALVAAYELLSPRLSRWRARRGGLLGSPARAVVVYVAGILISTVVAGLATAPFAGFHFHRLAVFGPAANLAAMPVVALWVMPWLMAALALMPFGASAVAAVPLRWGLEVVEAIAKTVAGWPDAVVAVPPMPVAALAVIALAGLWLCLWRRRWRLLGLPVLAMAMGVPWLMAGPDVVVAADGELLAIRSGQGLVQTPGRGDGFTRTLWTEMWGEGAGRWEARGLVDGAAGVSLRCDGRGCLYLSGDATVALVRHVAALREDCPVADAVVATVKVPWRHCPGPRRVIDAVDLYYDGAHALYLTAKGVRVESVAAQRGDRLWSRRSNRW